MRKNIASTLFLSVMLICSAFALLSTGCEYSNLDDVTVDGTTVSQPSPTPNPQSNNDDDDNDTPSPPSSGGSGDQRFLWKPVSENNGKLVVLLPARLTGKVSGVTVNGESGNFSGVHNGGREHYRFSKPGGSYTAPASVVAGLKAGGSESWSVASPGTRTTK